MHRDFTLRLETPAFIAGAMEEGVQTDLHDRGKKPRRRVIGMDGDGLRVPSLRGILRFWFRAKEGISGEALASQEARVFGSTEAGQGLRIIPLGQTAWNPKPIEADQGSALAYLGYGPLSFVGGKFSSHNKFAFREAVPEGAEISFRAVGSADQLEQLERCLRLLHLFGGIGGKSRRGWGSLAVLGGAVAPQEEGRKLQDWAAEVLRSVWPDESDRPSLRNSQPAHSAFFRNTEIRFFTVTGGSWERVMQAFHERFKETRLYDPFRRQRSPRIALEDHDLEDADARPEKGSIERVPLRIAYGLPYAATLGRRIGQPRTIEYEGRYRDDRDRSVAVKRRASPLFLKVLRGTGTNWHGIVLFLKSDFFGNRGTKIVAKGKQGEVEFPGYRAIESYFAPNWARIKLP